MYKCTVHFQGHSSLTSVLCTYRCTLNLQVYSTHTQWTYKCTGDIASTCTQWTYKCTVHLQVHSELTSVQCTYKYITYYSSIQCTYTYTVNLQVYTVHVLGQMKSLSMIFLNLQADFIAYWVILHAFGRLLIFFKINFLEKKKIQEYCRSISLNPDQVCCFVEAQCFVWPDLGPTCLKRLSAGHTCGQRINWA